MVEFPYLCKSVQSVGVFLSYAICGNFLSCVISGRIPQECLPQISQIITDCWCAFVLIFYDFTDSVFFGGFPYLCKSVQSVGVFLSYAICGNFLSCVISGRIPQECLPQISQIITDCWCAFVLIFYDFTDSVFFGGFLYLCKSVQSVEPFCRVQSVGETLYLEYPFILRCISLFILSVLKLTSIPKCKLHKRR